MLGYIFFKRGSYGKLYDAWVDFIFLSAQNSSIWISEDCG